MCHRTLLTIAPGGELRGTAKAQKPLLLNMLPIHSLTGTLCSPQGIEPLTRGVCPEGPTADYQASHEADQQQVCLAIQPVCKSSIWAAMTLFLSLCCGGTASVHGCRAPHGHRDTIEESIRPGNRAKNYKFLAWHAGLLFIRAT